MSECKNFEENIYLYCFDDLSEKDKKALEEHIHMCEKCKNELQNIQSTLNITKQKNAPDLNENFWQEYNTSLFEKIETEEFISPSIFKNFLNGIDYLVKSTPKPNLLKNLAFAALFLIIISLPFMMNKTEVANNTDTEEITTQLAYKDNIKNELDYNQTKIKDPNTSYEFAQTFETNKVDSKVTNEAFKEKNFENIQLASDTQHIQTEELETIFDPNQISVEDELLLQELTLLAELNEDDDIYISDDELIKNIVLINELAS